MRTGGDWWRLVEDWEDWWRLVETGGGLVETGGDWEDWRRLVETDADRSGTTFLTGQGTCGTYMLYLNWENTRIKITICRVIGPEAATGEHML